MANLLTIENRYGKHRRNTSDVLVLQPNDFLTSSLKNGTFKKQTFGSLGVTQFPGIPLPWLVSWVDEKCAALLSCFEILAARRTPVLQHICKCSPISGSQDPKKQASSHTCRMRADRGITPFAFLPLAVCLLCIDKNSAFSFFPFYFWNILTFLSFSPNFEILACIFSYSHHLQTQKESCILNSTEAKNSVILESLLSIFSSPLLLSLNSVLLPPLKQHKNTQVSHQQIIKFVQIFYQFGG